ncbi:MAG: hypothetical protein VCD34_07585, partial [Planctomycetota bacterium]
PSLHVANPELTKAVNAQSAKIEALFITRPFPEFLDPNSINCPRPCFSIWPFLSIEIGAASLALLVS